MWHVWIFLGCLLVCSGGALAFGGAPERIGGAIFLAGTAASILVGRPGFASAELGLLAVDGLICASFVALALRANRFWPMIVSAILLLQVFGHILKLAMPDMYPWLYWLNSSIWAYPTQIALLIGTINYRRLRRQGAVRSWSSFSTG